GGEDGALLGTLGGEDLGLAGAFGGQDRGALVALGTQLLLHRVLDGTGGVDGFQLDAVDPDPPLPGGLVEDSAQLAVDLLAGREGAFQVQPADHVAQRGDGQLLDGLDEVRDLVCGCLRVGDLEVQDRIDVDYEVVFGDDRLRRERYDLFPQVHAGPHPVDERHDGVEAGVQRPAVGTQPLDDIGARLRHNPDCAAEADDHYGGNGDDDDD